MGMRQAGGQLLRGNLQAVIDPALRVRGIRTLYTRVQGSYNLHVGGKYTVHPPDAKSEGMSMSVQVGKAA